MPTEYKKIPVLDDTGSRVLNEDGSAQTKLVEVRGSELAKLEERTNAHKAKLSDPEFYVLNRLQFTTLVFLLDIEEDIQTALNAIVDPVEKATAKARYVATQSFHRNHPLVNQLAEAIGLTKTQVDEAWLTAGKIKD